MGRGSQRRQGGAEIGGDGMTEILLIELDSQSDMLRMALSMYLGEKCNYCGVTFRTINDIKSTVWAGCHQWGRLAHKTCWDKNNA